jgi:hypothetical protein
MPSLYQHRQLGIAVLGITLAVFLLLVDLAVIIIIFVTTASALFLAIVSATILIVIASAIVFSSLTIQVTPTDISWHFGLGLLKKQVPISAIANVQEVKGKWWHGWGIRRLPGNIRLYAVSGLQAVELELEDGRKIRLGSDEAGKLSGAIRQVQA